MTTRHYWRGLCCALALLTGAPLLQAAESFTLPQLLALAQQHNKNLQAGQQSIQAAQAAVISASAIPNPEIETLSSQYSPRVVGPLAGSGHSVWLTQRLEYPSQRRARVDAAQAGLHAMEADARSQALDVYGQVALSFYEQLRRDAEFRAAQEDLALLEQIRQRVELRVNLGESARYELIKADAEVLNAQKVSESARLRVAQARARLRQFVGVALPEDFQLQGKLGQLPQLPSREQLNEQLLRANPELQRAQALVEQAEQQLAHERSLRLPSIAVKGGYAQEPEIRSQGLGLVFTVPIFDQRRGPVAEAQAQLSRSQLQLDERRFALVHMLEGAYQQYQLTLNQVAALENGVLRQAEAALKVAEAAYRYGERGILDYLDAQRVFRSARNELITARFELQAAAIDVNRLRAAMVPGAFVEKE